MPRKSRSRQRWERTTKRSNGRQLTEVATAVMFHLNAPDIPQYNTRQRLTNRAKQEVFWLMYGWGLTDEYYMFIECTSGFIADKYICTGNLLEDWAALLVRQQQGWNIKLKCDYTSYGRATMQETYDGGR